ncbi:MAG: hypothetical protein AMXMBFR33_31380 [Candidatus Xenobia bacterium]
MKFGRRGVAVATVLAGSVLLLAFCLLVASFCLTQLDFARNFREHAQSEQLARAALSQFIDAERRRDQPDDPLSGQSLSQRYHWQNLFGARDSQRLGGEVAIGFTPHRESGYYSLDNSQNSLFARSCLDQGDAKSVPPYSAQLLIRVKAGPRVQWFDALVQKRWPYVLASSEPVALAANRIGTSPGPGSSVTGNLLCFPRVEGEPLHRYPLALSADQMQGVGSHISALEHAGVTIGGRRDPSSSLSWSTGNRLIGNVDFVKRDPLAGQPRVAVGGGNTWRGTSRVDLEFPSDFLNSITGGPGVPSDWNFLIRSSGDALINSETDSQGRQLLFRREGRPFYLMNQSLAIQDAPPADHERDPSAQYAIGSAFVVEGSMGNRYIPRPLVVTDDREVRIRPSRLMLKNARLFVDGDLDLSGPLTDVGNNPQPLLIGSNATLVVRGTLTIDGGMLDAVDQGMVIYCQRLLMKASGDYRGLIVVRDSALFYPEMRSVTLGTGTAQQLKQFTIRGGLVIGGGAVRVYEEEANLQNGSLVQFPPPDPQSMEFQGTGFFSLNLEYDPSYLQALHTYGQFQLYSLRRVH